jgi:phosphoglycerate dehydrogenase-like enzyme
MKVVLTTVHLGEEFIPELRETFPGVTFTPALTPEDKLRETADADACLGWPGRDAYLAARKLRWIHNVGMGIDWIREAPELVTADVVVTNAPGPHTNPMADHVLAVMLALAHNLRELTEDQRAKRWDIPKYEQRMVELNGSVLGVLSLGGIGRAVAQRAYGFGMQVYAVDPSPTDIPAGVREVWGPEQLDHLLSISDWFVVAAPLVAETVGLIDARRIALMKPGSYLIVISRGGIVDEEALADALKSGHLAGAAVDATAVEPLLADSPLWELDNLILSPHTSGTSRQLVEGRRRVFLENLRRFLGGRPLAHRCDKARGY